MAPQDVLTFLVQQKHLDNVPKASIALLVVLTLPVSVASAERSSFMLRFIKTFGRFERLQNRLDALARSLEPGYASALNMAELSTKFAKKKAQTMRF